MRRFCMLPLAAAVLLAGAAVPPAFAHPMGNFSINHYAGFTVERNTLTLRYVLDMAEIPAVTERRDMDKDSDGAISEAERSAYLAARVNRLRSGLTILVGGRAPMMSETTSRLEFKPGAGGLDTLRLAFTLTTGLGPASSNEWHIVYRDANFAERTGWKEIVATAGEGSSIVHSTCSRTDTSRELTAYPADPTAAPPQQTDAEFTVLSAYGAVSARAGAASRPTSPGTVSLPESGGGAARTPRDGFTQAISRKALTTTGVAISLGLAFLFGAFHALSPGHGKAMVAAYLVGARGTVRHAVFLGGVITLTHTVSVFAMGLITLLAAQYVVPEKLYPVLSVVSGLLIAGVGASLFVHRLSAILARRRDREESRCDGDGYGEGPLESPLPDNVAISVKSLIVLGVTGGVLPCPSALVVMLGAIALHRIAFGMALISAFSLGLACVLTGIGVLVVRLRRLVDRLPLHDGFTSRLPIFSAALVTGVGLFLVVRALNGQP